MIAEGAIPSLINGTSLMSRLEEVLYFPEIS